MRRDGFFPPGLLVHRLSQGQIRAVSVSTQFCRSRNGSRRGKARRAYACMAKGFDEAWAHFCPSKPCLPLSIDVMLQLGLKFVFEIYGAKKVSLGVFENNLPAYYCYKAVGFNDVVLDTTETYCVLGEEWKCKEMIMENR